MIKIRIEFSSFLLKSCILVILELKLQQRFYYVFRFIILCFLKLEILFLFQVLLFTNKIDTTKTLILFLVWKIFVILLYIYILSYCTLNISVKLARNSKITHWKLKRFSTNISLNNIARFSRNFLLETLLPFVRHCFIGNFKFFYHEQNWCYRNYNPTRKNLFY